MKLTPKVVAYVAHEEGLVLEAYKDSVGVWTWALGVTDVSGHEVHPRYLDRPQPLEHCLQVSIWLLKERYLPAVREAFAGHALSEAQLAAALGFQWNTGAILTTQWAKQFLAGRPRTARTFLETHYLNQGALAARRQREAALFFDGTWPAPMPCPVYPIRLPSHTPNFRRGVATDLLPMLTQILAKTQGRA